MNLNISQVDHRTYDGKPTVVGSLAFGYDAKTAELVEINRRTIFELYGGKSTAIGWRPDFLNFNTITYEPDESVLTAMKCNHLRRTVLFEYGRLAPRTLSNGVANNFRPDRT